MNQKVGPMSGILEFSPVDQRLCGAPGCVSARSVLWAEELESLRRPRACDTNA